MFETPTTLREQFTEIESPDHRRSQGLRKSHRRTPRSKAHRKKGSLGLVERVSRASKQDIGLAIGLVVFTCLLNGEEPHIVCNLTTSILAAILSGLMIKDPDTSGKSTKAILGLWILFASMMPFDYLIGHVSGYFALKFVLSMTSIGYVYRIYEEKEPAEITSSPILSKCPDVADFTDTHLNDSPPVTSEQKANRGVYYSSERRSKPRVARTAVRPKLYTSNFSEAPTTKPSSKESQIMVEEMRIKISTPVVPERSDETLPTAMDIIPKNGPVKKSARKRAAKYCDDLCRKCETKMA